MPTAPIAGAHAAIVYNPVRVPLERLKRAVEAQELQHGWRPSRWHETSSDDHGIQAATDALAHGPAVVLAAGGDGTVRAVGEALQGSGVPMALLPLGTGNLLARNLKLPLGDVDASVAAAFGGATRAIDVAIAELEDEAGGHRRHAFLVMAGIGLDAAMAEQTNALAKRHLGWVAYVPPIARSITANRLLQLRYRIDGGPARSDRAHTLIVGNCGTLTGSMLLLPAAAPALGMGMGMMKPMLPQLRQARDELRALPPEEQDQVAAALVEQMQSLNPEERASMLEHLDGGFFPPRVAQRVRSGLAPR